MTRIGLSNRITIALIGFALFVVAAFCVSIDSIRRAMNQEAQQRSISTVLDRLDTLHGKLRMLARDYNNWADVYLALGRNDIAFVADNYAITAIFGDMFNAVSMFDGPLERPIAWIAGGSREPAPSFLRENELSKLREKVRLLDVESRETFDFYYILNGNLHFACASYILPDTPELLESATSDQRSISVLARALRTSEIEEMERSLEISDAGISNGPEPGKISLPLKGAEGFPVAYISWVPPRSGDRLIITLLPVLVGICFAFLAISALGITALRRNADDLLRRERASTLLARTDSLTGLPNRLAFTEFMSSTVSMAPNTLALIVLDLNGFKRINDMVGHQGGDQILCRVAKCLIGLSGQVSFVARLGGDEFAVVVSCGHELLIKVEEISAKIIDELHVNCEIRGFSFEINAAQGAAINEIDVPSEEELLRRADYAMYIAKQQKSSKIEFYSEDMERISLLDRGIEAALREALNHPDEFSIVYQPIVCAARESFVRAEALARWKSASLGAIGPDSFIRVAEESDLIIPLGWLLINAVLRDVATRPRLCVSINVSPIQIMEEDFVDRLLRLLARYHIQPGRIELEITERVMIMNTDTIGRRLRSLQSVGVTIAFDDFGSGFTSMGALRALPFDTLKIDRALVAYSADSSESRDLVQSVVQLGHSMRSKVVGEGVESSSDAYFLSLSGCDYLQGYFFGGPMPIRDLEELFLRDDVAASALLEDA